MTKTAFIYGGKDGTYIKTSVLHKAPKGYPSCDRILLEIISGKTKEKQSWAMTQKEAIIISGALIQAVLIKER